MKLTGLALASASLFTAVMLLPSTSVALEESAVDAVVANYADIALAGYEDSVTTAQALDVAIQSLIQTPSQDTLDTARAAWLSARVPYQQTEVYRFGNAIVDDWEGKVNAWPLDEGLIDYVDSAYGGSSEDNTLYTANIIANPALIIGGKEIDATNITPDLLESQMHEAGGIESNVATGYHAIEFLLWGQDLNGDRAGAGNRPYTDFSNDGCTGGNCDRRAAYLIAVSQLLISDLQEMVDNWAENGAAREALTEAGPSGSLMSMLIGMGSLSYGELAGERMQLGLMLHDPEEEHDCFSDNTSASHYYDGLGIRNVFRGVYKRVDGSTVSGASLESLIAGVDENLAKELAADLDISVAALDKVLESQHQGVAYDQLIAEGNDAGNALVQTAIDALKNQTKGIERAVAALDLGDFAIEGSDSLDDPSSVFQ